MPAYICGSTQRVRQQRHLAGYEPDAPAGGRGEAGR